MAKQQVILVPVDDTDTAESVLDYVLHEVYREGDVVHLFHVVPVPMPESFSTGLDTLSALEPDPAEDAKHIADAKAFIRQRFAGALERRQTPYRVDIVHFLTDEDSIGQAICERADQLAPRAVVLAKHQRGRIAEYFMGSAAKHVASRCRWPVTLLHEGSVRQGGGGGAGAGATGIAGGMKTTASEGRITGF